MESEIDRNQSCCEGGKVRRCRNRLAAPIWPPGAIPELHGVLIHEKRFFSYFSHNRNRRAVV